MQSRAETTSCEEPGAARWPRRLLILWRERLARRRAARELAAMSERELRDIGLARCEIPAALAGHGVRGAPRPGEWPVRGR